MLGSCIGLLGLGPAVLILRFTCQVKIHPQGGGRMRGGYCKLLQTSLCCSLRLDSVDEMGWCAGAWELRCPTLPFQGREVCSYHFSRRLHRIAITPLVSPASTRSLLSPCGHQLSSCQAAQYSCVLSQADGWISKL